MITRRTEVLRAIKEATRLVDKFDDSNRPGFDILRPFEKLDVPLLFQPLDKLLGATVRVDSVDVGVIVTTQRQLHTQRFTLAHELGHVLLGHRMKFDLDVGVHLNPQGARDSPEEAAADYFASEVLASSDRIVRIADKHDWRKADLQKPEVVYQLSLRLGISYSAAVWALYAARVLQYRAAKHLHDGGIPKGLKAAIGERKLDDSWADAWEIGPGDGGTVLEGGPSDLFSVKLEEHVASGYRWVIQQPSAARVEDLQKIGPERSIIGQPVPRHLLVTFADPASHPLHLIERRAWNGMVAAELKCTVEAWGKEARGLPRRVKARSLQEGSG